MIKNLNKIRNNLWCAKSWKLAIGLGLLGFVLREATLGGTSFSMLWAIGSFFAHVGAVLFCVHMLMAVWSAIQPARDEALMPIIQAVSAPDLVPAELAKRVAHPLPSPSAALADPTCAADSDLMRRWRAILAKKGMS